MAQTAAPAKTTAPAATTTQTAPAVKKATKTKKMTMTSDQKAAVSKACSAAADKQGLKGKERKKFREHCKHQGGPAK